MKSRVEFRCEMLALIFGAALVVVGTYWPLVIAYLVFVGQLAFVSKSMWSAFWVTLIPALVLGFTTVSPEPALMLMAYGLAGGLMGTAAKRCFIKGGKQGMQLRLYSYSGLLFRLTAIMTVAQTAYFGFLGRMYGVSAARFWEHALLTSFEALKEAYVEAGLWTALGMSDAVFDMVARAFRNVLPMQIVLSAFLYALLATFFFSRFLPVPIPMRQRLSEHWGRVAVPLSWTIGLFAAAALLIVFKDVPGVATTLINIALILAVVLSVSGVTVLSSLLSKGIKKLWLRVLIIGTGLMMLLFSGIGLLPGLVALLVFSIYGSIKAKKEKQILP